MWDLHLIKQIHKSRIRTVKTSVLSVKWHIFNRSGEVLSSASCVKSHHVVNALTDITTIFLTHILLFEKNHMCYNRTYRTQNTKFFFGVYVDYSMSYSWFVVVFDTHLVTLRKGTIKIGTNNHVLVLTAFNTLI